MSNGGKMQISAIGEQDFFLVSNPQFSFFKKAYRRHTNFAIETMEIAIDQNVANNVSKFGREMNVIIPRKGNLLHRLYLDINILGKISAANTTKISCANFVNSLIKNAQLKVGNTLIDSYTSQFKQMKTDLLNESDTIYQETGAKGGKAISTNAREINSAEKLRSIVPLMITNDNTPSNKTQKLIYEFDFWFTENIGNSLPLDSLSNHDIELIFNTETINNVRGEFSDAELEIESLKLYGDYVILDGEEKRRFAQSSHEYLIEQKQEFKTKTNTNITDGVLNSSNYRIEFNHPVKYLIWAINNPGNVGDPDQGPTYFVSQTFNSKGGNDGNTGSFTLQLNGENRTPRDHPIMYYTRYYPKLYAGNMAPLDTVGFYSFALNPFENEPSGSCNMSRIRDVNFIVSFSNSNNNDNISNKDLYIYGVNYNVFRITSGMGGLLYI